MCGKYDADVFRDGKGMFGLEGEEVGGQQPVYNSFGEIISGKKRPLGEEKHEEDEEPERTEDDNVQGGEGEADRDEESNHDQKASNEKRVETSGTEESINGVNSEKGWGKKIEERDHEQVRLDDATEAQPHPVPLMTTATAA